MNEESWFWKAHNHFMLGKTFMIKWLWQSAFSEHAACILDVFSWTLTVTTHVTTFVRIHASLVKSTKMTIICTLFYFFLVFYPSSCCVVSLQLITSLPVVYCINSSFLKQIKFACFAENIRPLSIEAKFWTRRSGLEVLWNKYRFQHKNDGKIHIPNFYSRQSRVICIHCNLCITWR